MRFGTIVGFQNPERWRHPWQDVYETTLRFVDQAEDVGLDEVWLTEHHFAEDGYCPALLPVAAAIAARTQRIRIGTKALLLPLHEPLRVAEDAAVVDTLSGGRLDLGVAAGYRPAEFEGFAIDPSERGRRMDEGLAVLRSYLHGGRLSFKGQHYEYGSAVVLPPPVQRPFPLWVGGRSSAAMRRAAREACHLMLADFILSNAAADYEAYAAALDEAGLRVGDFEVAAVAVVFVDEDRDRAWEIAGPHLLYQQNQYRRWFTEAGDRSNDRFVPAGSVDELERGSYLVGTPQDVRDGISQLRDEVPFTHFSFWMLLPGIDPEAASRSLELFSNEVVAKLRRRESAYRMRRL
jgi:alkanesulfonate monooxygenase SsuD/methylene tetrahydromethanopterin reductase-like flavin-dependent oxidoreductase (luciferase family)